MFALLGLRTFFFFFCTTVIPLEVRRMMFNGGGREDGRGSLQTHLDVFLSVFLLRVGD